MATVLIAGGTGMIGTALTNELLAKGYSVIILTRHPKRSNGNLSYAHWDPSQQTIDTDAIQKADYIINLAGAGVADKRWTKKRKQVLVDSRVNSGSLLVKTLTEQPNQVKAVIHATGIGWYGDDREAKQKRPFIETDPPGTDFLATTCVQWEGCVLPVQALGKRLVIFRMGPVLSPEGGALKEFIWPAKLGIAAILGNGKQMVSWVHIQDVCRFFIHAIEKDSVQGIYNGVSPNPVTNKELMLAVAGQLKGKFYIPFYVPAFLLKLLYGELSVEVLKSATVSNRKISDTGFRFLYPTIEAALKDLLKG